MSFVLREAAADDDAGLMSLSERAAMQGTVSLCIERHPSFFALRNERGEGYTVVGTAKGAIVGCISVTKRRVHWDRPREIAYVADLKVLPEWRRRGLAHALLRDVVRRDEPVLHVGTFAAGNEALRVTLASAGFPLIPLASCSAFQLLPWGLRSSRTRFLPARTSDADEIRALLQRRFSRLRLAPCFDDTAGLAVPIECFRLARRNGRIAAAIAVWDPSAIKQTRVMAVPPALRAFVRLSSLLPRSIARNRLPRERALLVFRHVRYAVCEEDSHDLLASLLKEAVREAGEREDHFLLFSCDRRDPIARTARGIPRLTYNYQLGAWHPAATIELGSHLYYDDPALA